MRRPPYSFRNFIRLIVKQPRYRQDDLRWRLSEESFALVCMPSGVLQPAATARCDG